MIHACQNEVQWLSLDSYAHTVRTLSCWSSTTNSKSQSFGLPANQNCKATAVLH